MGIREILALFKLFGDWINRALARHEQNEAQQSHDELEEDPGEWFDNHFAGADSDQRVQPGPNGTGTEADQTNAVESAGTATGGDDTQSRQ